MWECVALRRTNVVPTREEQTGGSGQTNYRWPSWVQTRRGFAIATGSSRNDYVACIVRAAVPSLCSMAIRHRLMVCFSAFAFSGVAERIRVGLIIRGTGRPC
jgi:hypothetical protein